MQTTVGVLGKKGQNVANTAVTMLKICEQKGANVYGLASSETVSKAKSLAELTETKLDSPVIVGCTYSMIPKHNERKSVV